MSLNLEIVKDNIDGMVADGLATPVTLPVYPIPEACTFDPESQTCYLGLLFKDLLEANAVIESADPLDPTNWKSPASQLAYILQAAFATQLTIGTNLFIGHEPDMPHACITVYDSGGPDQRFANLPLDEHYISITSRGVYSDAYSALHQIKLAIQSMPTVFVDGEKWVGVWALSNIASYGRDKEDRSLFSSNYRVTIETKKNIHRQP